jgi:hypothetical protein
MRSSNVAFATGEELGAGSFGTPYIFFPVDNYTYVYFHHIYDMVEVVPIIMHSVIKFLSPLSTAIDGISDLIEDLRIATHQTNLANSATVSAISLSELISKHISTPDISRVHEAIMNGASSVLKNKLEFNTSLRHGIENGAEMMFNCSSYYLVDIKEFPNTGDVK